MRGYVKKQLREATHRFKVVTVFSNWWSYFRSRRIKDDGETVLKTRSGLKIAVRHNTWDTKIVREQFIDRSYLRGFQPPAHRPVIVDVGSYIGDFALYCAHELNARVVAYEPTAENWTMLQKNLSLNPHLAERITAVNKGVSVDRQIVANVQTDGREIHVSSQWYADDPRAERRTFPCDTLTEVLDLWGLDRVDLLKVDCEGGEYDIFPSTPPEIFARIGSIVFEWHRIPDWESKLGSVRRTLESAGFVVERKGFLAYASRPTP